MHQTSKEPEFVETVKEIKNAEQEYERIISTAKEKADDILRGAKETVQQEHRKASEEIVLIKNERLRDGSKQIEETVAETIKKSRKEAEKISQKKLPAATVSQIVKNFLSSL